MGKGELWTAGTEGEEGEEEEEEGDEEEEEEEEEEGKEGEEEEGGPAQHPEEYEDCGMGASNITCLIPKWINNIPKK